MEIKLCFKAYSGKMTLGAMKEFKQKTGKDMWYSLTSFLNSFNESIERKQSANAMLLNLYDVIDFFDASVLFHCIIKAEMPEMDIEQIQDAMFRVGFLPTEDEGDLSEPWPLVMVKLASDVSNEMREVFKEEKKRAMNLGS